MGGANGADLLIGLAGKDSLSGWGGNDLLDGGAGDDTAVFSGAFADYQIKSKSGTQVVISDIRGASRDGTDAVANVEHFRFSDRIVDFNDLKSPPPIAHRSSRSATTARTSMNGRRSRAGCPTRTPKATAATKYQFWDGGSGASSGYIWTPDNAHNPAGTASRGGRRPRQRLGARRPGRRLGDHVVRAFDGTDWGAWDLFNFTTAANTAPVATIADHSLGKNEWAKLSNWVSYSDADGNAATQYQLWDSGTGASSGYIWTPDNAHQPAGSAITLLAADLDNAWVRGGQAAGSETMWVRAFDGTDWGAWDALTLTTHA